MTEPGEPSVDEIVDRLRQRVDERRRAGLYPPDLEEQLDLHFRHLALRGVRDRLRRLEEAFAEVDRRRAALDAARISTGSERPGGAVVHRAVARLVGRQVEGVLTQVREYADAVSEAHRAVTLLSSDLFARLDELRDRFAAAEALEGSDTDRVVADLHARVAALEEAEARRRAAAWRAGATAVADDGTRYGDLAGRIRADGPVVVLGAPWLAAALEGRGVEFHHDDRDPVGYLASLDAASAGGVMAAGVFETLRPDEHLALVPELLRVVSPGGIVAVDLRSPAAVGRGDDAGAPAHPAYVTFLLREAGFVDVDVEWHGLGDDVPTPQRLATALFGSPGCTVVAVRP